MKCALLVLVLWAATSTAALHAGGPEFTRLFDGQTLDGWEGDEPFWRVREGAILGEITPDTRIGKNRFLIYQRELPDDFELVAEFRVSREGNSGINYRSKLVEGIDFHALAGYQCDIDGQMRYTGSNYEERIRTTLAGIGESVVLPQLPDAGSLRYAKGNQWSARKIVEQLGEADGLRKQVKVNDWNEARIVARGNVLEHYINNVLMSRVVDDDTANRRLAGRLGVQVHVGPPMTIEYRTIRLRAIEPASCEVGP
ncbi:MAG: DUF1080 domain-containing protein [Planctomycetales bacterium]|nr:DUF1080 domain-containing protein [Planctomycetales bacterium]